MQNRILKTILLLLLAASVLGASSITEFEEARNGPADIEGLEVFFDSVIPGEMEEHHIPGAVVVIVQDGDIHFSKGYGYADVDAGIIIDPESTLFRVGSISKLFTWTAVMQMVEQGSIDLDVDINDYLDFEIPVVYNEPITMRHLMGHTAGFEDRSFSIYAENTETQAEIGEWLQSHIPAQVRPPGVLSAYSNYGTSLAGYIVERVSGMIYVDYLEQNIFLPLDMPHSTARQPLPAELDDNMSKGYHYINGAYESQDFELFNIVPAGGISATAADMANFMIAHLQDGRFEDQQILETKTAQQMHTRHFTHDERINGMAHGFWEQDRGDQRIIGHGGDTVLFHSGVMLLLEENTGVFISCNSAEGEGFPLLVYESFMDQYYPLEDVATTKTSDFDERADLVAGLYRPNRISYTTAESVLGFLGASPVTVTEDGVLLARGDRYIETEPFLFRQIDGDGMISFRQDETGNVTHFFIHEAPPYAFERVPASDAPSTHLTLLGVSSLLFFSVIIGAPVVFLVRCRRKQNPQPRLAQVSRGIQVAMVVVSIVFLISIGITIINLGTNPIDESCQLIQVWKVIFIGLLALALVSTGMVVLAWKYRYWRLFGRVHYTLVALSAWALIWFTNYWHLLRW